MNDYTQTSIGGIHHSTHSNVAFLINYFKGNIVHSLSLPSPIFDLTWLPSPLSPFELSSALSLNPTSPPGADLFRDPQVPLHPRPLYKYHIRHDITIYMLVLQRLFNLFINKRSRVRTPWHPLLYFFDEFFIFYTKKWS